MKTVYMVVPDTCDFTCVGAFESDTEAQAHMRITPGTKMVAVKVNDPPKKMIAAEHALKKTKQAATDIINKFVDNTVYPEVQKQIDLGSSSCEMALPSEISSDTVEKHLKKLGYKVRSKVSQGVAFVKVSWDGDAVEATEAEESVDNESAMDAVVSVAVANLHKFRGDE